MSRVDLIIVIAVSAMLGFTVAVVTFFNSELLQPMQVHSESVCIRRDCIETINYRDLVEKGALEPVRDSGEALPVGDASSLGLDAYNPQETINNSKLQGYFE